MALGRCSGLFSEGVTSWDETGQCCHWRIIPFSLLRTLVQAGFCMFPQSWLAQRLQDLYSACLMFWMRTHTGPRFIVSSEGRESHQPQVIWASLTNSKILVPDGARTPNLSHWSDALLLRHSGSLMSLSFFIVCLSQYNNIHLFPGPGQRQDRGGRIIHLPLLPGLETQLEAGLHVDRATSLQRLQLGLGGRMPSVLTYRKFICLFIWVLL
jgi:hypothetical protein